MNFADYQRQLDELEHERGLPVHAIVGIREAVEYLHAHDVGGVRHVDDAAYERLDEYWRLHGAAESHT